LAGRVDLSTVGHRGLGAPYNEWLYRARFRALDRLLSETREEIEGAAVLEIGAGSGAYVPFWETRGAAQVTGVDITDASIEHLRTRYPRQRFVRWDVTATDRPFPDACFDVVTAFDVLFHIVDDSAFDQAIANIAALTRPGGSILLSDHFGEAPWGPFFHEYHRAKPAYLRSLAGHGIEPVDLQPTFVTMTTVMNQPADHGRIAAAAQALTLKPLSLMNRFGLQSLGHVVGAALYALDALLIPSTKHGPSHHFLLARKIDRSSSSGNGDDGK
jgi:SAM-dependent methyltransferase